MSIQKLRKRWRCSYATIVMQLVLIGVLGSCMQVRPPAPVADSSSLRQLVAHRGYHAQAADNTLEAFIQAARSKVPMLEFDVRPSSDGELFLFHDRTLKQNQLLEGQSFAGREFSTLTSAQVRTLVLNDLYRSRIPSFASVLEALKPYPVMLLPEPKVHTVQALQSFLDTLDQHGYRGRAIVQCLALDVLKFVSEQPRHFITLGRITNAEQLSEVLRFSPAVVQPDEEFLTASLVSAIKQSGARILVKTLDPVSDLPSHHRALFDRGVDYVLTDHPLE